MLAALPPRLSQLTAYMSACDSVSSAESADPSRPRPLPVNVRADRLAHRKWRKVGSAAKVAERLLC